MRICFPTHLFDMAPLLGDWHLESLDAGWDMNPVLLLRDAEVSRYRIVHLTAAGERFFDVPAGHDVWHHAQAVGRDRWLVARGRASNPGIANVHLYSSSGELQAAFHAGDAIRRIQPVPSGLLWITYYAEGQRQDLSSSAVVAFDFRGVPSFRYYDPSGSIAHPFIGLEPNINVMADEAVWLEGLDHFVLVERGKVTRQVAWSDSDEPPSSEAFAISGERVLAFREGTFALVSLDTREIEPVTIHGTDGEPLQPQRVWGRGGRLFIKAQSDLYRINVNECLVQPWQNTSL